MDIVCPWCHQYTNVYIWECPYGHNYCVSLTVVVYVTSDICDVSRQSLHIWENENRCLISKLNNEPGLCTFGGQSWFHAKAPALAQVAQQSAFTQADACTRPWAHFSPFPVLLVYENAENFSLIQIQSLSFTCLLMDLSSMNVYTQNTSSPFKHVCHVDDVFILHRITKP